MYELVPPKSGQFEYKSLYMPELTFILKIFDFDEDEIQSSMLFKHAKIDDKGKFVKDSKGHYIIDNDSYYYDVFKFGVKDIIGIDKIGLKPDENGKIFYRPSIKILKEVVNKINKINTVTELEK
jgi:hypothetical protein